MSRRSTLVLIGAIAACSSSPPSGSPTPYADTTPEADAVKTPVVTLERTSCFGTCPVYQVTITPAGAVRFVGKKHVVKQGEATAEIPTGRVDTLLRELEAGGYFGFEDKYVMDSPACGQYATDSPTVITSATIGDRTKKIRHDHGCAGAPPELARLERLIDEVAGADQWTGR
jgi:Domain of unknown function (DUF6438)